MTSLQDVPHLRPSPVEDGARPWTGRLVLAVFVGFFAVVFSVNGLMMYFATSTFGGVEVASSYKAGLEFSGNLAAARAQDARGWRVNAHVEPREGGRVLVTLDAQDREAIPLSGYGVDVRISHPTSRRLDRELTLKPVGPGRYEGEADLSEGQWDLVLDMSRDGQTQFRSRQRFLIQSGRAVPQG